MEEETVADEAHEAVHGDRQEAYGRPSENHGATAELWRAYIARRHGLDVELDAEDVCWLNVLQKVSRQAYDRRRDNLVDVVGYTLNVELIGRDRP